MDSWAKLPTGIYEENAFSFGNFDQCLAVQRSKMQPQYCLVELKTPDPGPTVGSSSSSQGDSAEMQTR